MKPETNLPVRNLTENLVLAGFMLFLLLLLAVEKAIDQYTLFLMKRCRQTKPGDGNQATTPKMFSL